MVGMTRQGLAQHSEVLIHIHSFTCGIFINAFLLPSEIMPFIANVRYRLCIGRSAWRSLNPEVNQPEVEHHQPITISDFAHYDT
jgi:hypothetical protein